MPRNLLEQMSKADGEHARSAASIQKPTVPIQARLPCAIDVSQVTYISYDAATGDQHVAIWPMGREFIRRATSATSAGDPEPLHDMTVAD